MSTPGQTTAGRNGPEVRALAVAPARLLRSCGRRLVAAVVLVVWLCTPVRAAEAAAKEDQVIFPRAGGASEPATAGRAGGTSPLLLVVAIGAAAAGGWMLWRQRRAPGGLGGRDSRRLSVVESRGLGNRQYLVVADYDGQKFLLGVCPGRIEMLSKLGGNPGEGRG